MERLALSRASVLVLALLTLTTTFSAGALPPPSGRVLPETCVPAGVVGPFELPPDEPIVAVVPLPPSPVCAPSLIPATNPWCVPTEVPQSFCTPPRGLDTLDPWVDADGDVVTGDLVLENDVVLRGRDTTGYPRALAYVTSSDKVVLGSANLPLVMASKVDPVFAGLAATYPIWHGGNDGRNSNLDADLLDGLDSAQFVRADADSRISGSLNIRGDIDQDLGEFRTRGSVGTDYLHSRTDQTDLRVRGYRHLILEASPNVGGHVFVDDFDRHAFDPASPTCPRCINGDALTLRNNAPERHGGYVSLGFDMGGADGNHIAAVRDTTYPEAADFLFKTRRGGGSSEVWIKSDGRVGIGTSQPENALDVSGTITAHGTPAAIGADSPGNLRLGFAVGCCGSEAGGLPTISAGNSIPVLIGHQMAGVHLGKGDFREQMRIDVDGRVGIGTNSPGDTLDVNGGVRAERLALKPALDLGSCSEPERGRLVFLAGTGGVASDAIHVCMRGAGNVYAWRPLLVG